MKYLKNTLIWFWLLTKRYFKKPIFLITILLIPILTITLRNYSGKDESVIQIVLYVENAEENTLANEVVEKLCAKDGNAIRFYTVDSKQLFEKDVQNGTAICGYMFPDRFVEHLKNYINKDKKSLPFDGKVIRCISLSDNNYISLGNEVIFSAIYDDFSKEVLNNFVDHSSYFKDLTDGDKEELATLRNQYDDLDVDFFSFYNIDGSSNQFINAISDSYLVLPLRGLILALILLASMTGSIMLSKDIESGFFDAISLKKRRRLSYLYTLIPCFFASITGFIAIMFSGTSEGIGIEILNMILYCFMAIGFTNTIFILLNDIHRFVSVIPVFIIINLILCPVFINITSSFPILSYVRWVLPVNYGLTGLHYYFSRIIMLIIGIMGFIISLTVTRTAKTKKD